jgi:S-adenosylmethionine:tRNA ribosyltransferase-isomerase
MLPKLGKVPLPPYINKEVDDPELYQTIYAREEGSAAAPTAGFHFTDDIFKVLEGMGVETAYVTLHIGPGTFQPVKVEDIRDHLMHKEYFRVDQETADRLNLARKYGGRIIAVGTTACRVLETVADASGVIHPADNSTGLYIYPGFKFKAVDAMLTNFHLPRSSLLMLVSALAGHGLIMSAYEKAVSEQYRFFSFGDCMFIL